MTISTAELFDLYDRSARLAAQYPALADAFAPVQRQFDDKRRQPDASIMVYGIYNAGKSTLINALVGERVAKTGDIPLTDRIDAYTWNNCTILDTPGVDAPLVHEEVTREQMLKADAVIFVVNPSGAAEEEKTLKVLIEILQAQKKLFLVLNQKDKMDVEVFTRLKNDLRVRLQALAAEKGMHEVLADIPILRVNAEMALQARLENNAGLLRHSEFPALEAALTAFTTAIDNQHIYQRLSSELAGFLEGAARTLSDDSAVSDTVRDYQALLKEMVDQQYQCRKNIHDEIQRQHDVMQRGCLAALRQQPQQAQEKIEALFEQASGRIAEVQQQEVEHLVLRFQQQVDSLQAAVQRQQQAGPAQSAPAAPQDRPAAAAPDAPSGSVLNTDTIQHAVTSLGALARPEHVVSGLKLVKEWLPSLMKGIGPKTMEKWGAAVIGKWIPYVGPAIAVIGSLWDIIGEDRDSKQAREESEQQRREWERYQQEIHDFAATSADQFRTAATRLVNDTLEPWFTEMLDRVKASRDIASQQEQTRSDAMLEAGQLASRLRALNA